MSPKDPEPPVAYSEPRITELHGRKLQDDYAWLRDKAAARTLDYLNAENAYTAASMAGTDDLQHRLYGEMLSHIQEDDTSVPYRDGEWVYWTRTEKGRQYPIYLRAPAAEPGAAETLLDVNALAAAKPFMQLGALAISPDGKLLAYTTDTTGFRQYTLQLLDLPTRELHATFTAERVGSIAWAADSATLFFTTEDEQTKRQDRLWRRTLDSPAVEVFHEPDERFNLAVGRTRDRQYLLLESGSHTSSETWFLSANEPAGSFRLIAPRVDDEEYSVDHREGSFYIRTNYRAEQFRLMRSVVSSSDRGGWTEILPEAGGSPLEDFDLFQGFLVASYRESGLPILRVFPLDEAGQLAQAADIRFPDAAYEAFTEINRDFHATTLRYAYESLVRPASVFTYDVTTQQSTLLKEQAVPGGFEASRYKAERLWFRASDGTQVPVSLVYRSDRFSKDGSAPLHLYGYGSYGYALPLGFRATRLALLDRGVVLAYAHIRGGGELGDPWHDGGKMMAKRTTFTDFIEATEFLVGESYADRTRVAIEGGSAGGLLMGAVVNMRPDLFRVVISHVPFVDVMNTMLDASLPLTVAEYEEWGNPNDLEAFTYMSSYSPYENLDSLAGKALPSMLIKTSLNDSQVMCWEPAKYVAKLRTLKTDRTPLLLHINMEAGHGGASGRYDYLKELAFDDAFLLRELGIEEA